jgi:integrase-like protein
LTIAESATEVGGELVLGTPKTHHQRTVPLPAVLLEALARRCEGKQPDDLLVTTASGTALRLRNWRRAVWDPAVRAAGLSDVTPHDLRHTAASLAVASGANVKSVQRMLGHASAAMTLDVYSGLFDDDLTALADRMDAAARAAEEARVGAVWARAPVEPSGKGKRAGHAVGPVGIEPTTRGLTIFKGWCYKNGPKPSPVLVRNPVSSAGRYCIRLSRVFTSAVSSVMVCLVRLASDRFRWAQTGSTGLSSWA